MPFSSRSSRPALCLALVVLGGLVAAPTGVAAARKRHAHGHRFVRILVKLRPHSRAASLERRFAALGARPAGGLRHLHVQVLRVRRARARAVAARLRRLHAVRYVDRNRVVMHVTANLVQNTPTDPLWGQQWGAALTGAPTAWAVTVGAPSVVVAVLDTGVDFTQPDLQGVFVPGYDFVNNDSDPTDDLGHGTAVAGVIAARMNNGMGGSGLCPLCSIMPVKVAAADGSATELNVASGITWAADHGARVINLSLGGTFGATVRDAVNYAIGKGVLVVAAAGNNGNSNLFYPAADDGVLSVAGTQSDDALYPWSDYGSWVAVAAPGCDFTTMRGGTYGDFCGTSASTPVVSALAGLAMSYAPAASADAVKNAITSSAHKITGVNYGRVDFAATLAALGATFQVAPTVAPPPPAAPVPPPPAAPVSAGMNNAGSTVATHASAPRMRPVRRSRTARLRAVRILRQVRVEPSKRDR